MKNKLISLWQQVRSSLWFVPGMMVLAALLLAYVTSGLENLAFALLGRETALIYHGTPAGARSVLATIAGSMITVAGVVFSLTMVVLSQAASQFGPRLVRNFMDDRGNQLVLGTFVATFVYCLVVMPTLSADGEHPGPSLVVTLGLGLALASLAVLIYFIHHIASSIQANNLTARVGRELEQTVRRLYPEADDDPGPEPEELPPGFDQRAAPLWAHSSGYLQLIDLDRLCRLAGREDLLVKLTRRPGDFVINGNPLALVWPPESLTPALAMSLHRCLTLGVERTEAQDVEYVARLLAETALRALSSGVNDPFTAINCVDWLGSGLALMAGRGRRAPWRRDPEGNLRLLCPETGFAHVAHACLDPIRRAARENVMCTARLLEVTADLAGLVRTAEDHRVLVHLAEAVKIDGLEELKLAWDRDFIARRHQAAVEALARAELRLAS